MIIFIGLIAPVLVIAHQAIAEETVEDSNGLYLLGSRMQDVVLHTIAWCPEIFGFPSNNENERNIICKVFTKMQNMNQDQTARAYYGGPAYHTYVSGFEPMTLLAGLAFLAFLLQTLHALLYRGPATATLAPVSISRGTPESENQLTDRVLTAFEKYDTLNKRSLVNDSSSSWPTIFTSIFYTLSSYWDERNSPHCKQNLMCRLFGKQSGK